MSLSETETIQYFCTLIKTMSFITESPQGNGQNPRMQNSMFRQAEQYYNQGQKH